ncbi:MAG: allophanate hydrolase, partial [Deltaproteobacteria bacterium]|nr:allophanate hydrolase [Deltaproteobacteria bacterium]
MGFRVIQPGVQTTFQDLGRPGFRRYGIPRSGAMDPVALRAANLLVGNPEGAAALEVTLQGLKLEAKADLAAAVAGADLGCTVNGRPCPPWRAFGLRAGEVLV